MARIARVVVPGLPHHVTQRGVRSMDIFADDEDREVYLALLSESAAKHGLDFWAWCLMSNHVHLVAVPCRKESLARAIGEAHWRYVRRVNLREGVRGRLFQGRFESYPVQQDSHLMAVMRYVELNPVKARVADRPEEWPWSSARYNLRRRKHDALVRERIAEVTGWPWHEVLRDGQEEIEAKRIELHMGTGRPYGADSWAKGLEKKTGRRLRPEPIGWPKGRPRKKTGSGRGQ